MRLRVFRFDPDRHARPVMQDYDVPLEPSDRMVLDALTRLKAQDDSITYRRSCREGVCGSDAMNINGRNALACITPLEGIKQPVTLAPLPGFPVIRDLVVDMTQFFMHYHSIKPYVMNDEPLPERERLQSPEEREKLNGLYECILCAACSSFCPPYWWNPDKFIGPAGLLQAQRFSRQPRPRHQRAPGVPGRRLQALPLSHGHELHRGLPQGTQPRPGDRAHQDCAAAAQAGLKLA